MLRRVKAYLDEVCELDDPRSRGKGLTGDLAGDWRYRIGDYRVLVRSATMTWSSSRSRSGTDPAYTEHPRHVAASRARYDAPASAGLETRCPACPISRSVMSQG